MNSTNALKFKNLLCKISFFTFYLTLDLFVWWVPNNSTIKDYTQENLRRYFHFRLIFKNFATWWEKLRNRALVHLFEDESKMQTLTDRYSEKIRPIFHSLDYIVVSNHKWKMDQIVVTFYLKFSYQFIFTVEKSLYLLYLAYFRLLGQN